MFTVLMPMCSEARPAHLWHALHSLAVQTCAPADVLLVKDGPVSPQADEVISEFQRRLPLRILALTRRVGLARALNEGLKLSNQTWVMRFDADDICLPGRIELQTAMALDGGAQLFGAQIEEFDCDTNSPIGARAVPCSHKDILRYGQRRNPFNHMTVCFRRDLVLQLGGYPEIPFMEDYALWMLMLAKGVRAANSDRTLVRVRAGAGMIARRGGTAYVASELMMQRHMVQLGLKTRLAGYADAALRSSVFLSPSAVRGWLYSRLLRT